ncbi:MAG TPA: prolyl oligopeptidase family serine peptidase [Thermoanaerobaculia bacterium]|jgi:dipeptidyl aminopeptidase/acylaminoacyl peptidase
MLLLAAPSLAAVPPAISGLSFSPDGGKVLVSMDADGVPNAWALPVAGGPAMQLTRSPKNPVWTLGYFPRDERLLYRSGPAGDENHLFVRELDGKTVELFPGQASYFVGWVADGPALLVEIENGGSQSRDLYRIAADGYAKTLVNRNSSQLARLVLASPDGHYLAYRESSNDLIRNIRVRDLKSGKDRSQLVGDGFTVHIPVSFSPDSSSLLVLDDIDKEFKTREFRALGSWDLTTGASRALLEKSWDVLDALYSPDGKRLAVVAGGDTRSDLELYDAATLQPIALPAYPPVGDVAAVAFSRDGRELAFLASGGTAPPAVWVYALGSPSSLGAPRRLGTVEATAGIEGTVIRVKAPDKTEIPGILYKPAQASPGHKVAAVVWIHDGPSGQSRLGFDPFVQALVQRGYAVFAINERGSSGYGRAFLQLDDRRHGTQDLDDCVAARDMLAATGWVDPARIALGGVGFGGYLTLTALAFRPQEFAAGIDLFGIANWQRVLDGLPYSSAERTILADEMGHAGSQATNLWAPYQKGSEIVRPLIVVQGARDALAVPAEAAELVAAMKAKGRAVEEIVLPDAAHALVLRADREKVYKAVADFLDRNLKAAASK